MQTNRNDNPGNENRDSQNDRNQNTGNLGNESQNMGSRGNGLNNPGMENDNYKRDIDNPTEAQSKTFNEDEATWEKEQKASGNQGTRDNDWNENDQFQRSPGMDYEEEDHDTASRGQYNDEEENKYSREEDRRNREELE